MAKLALSGMISMKKSGEIEKNKSHRYNGDGIFAYNLHT